MIKVASVLLLVLAASPAFPFLAADRRITFEERVAAQAALEKVLYNHRQWPHSNPDEKPPFEKVVPGELLEAKVADCLRKSAALEKFWGITITASDLSEELDRMARDTKDPATLKELFAALGNDPGMIAECLAKPALVERMSAKLYSYDARLHSVERESAEKTARSLLEGNHPPAGNPGYSVTSFFCVPGIFGDAGMSGKAGGEAVRLSQSEFSALCAETPAPGKFSAVMEMDDRFLILHTLSKNRSGIEYECLSFPKKPIGEWLASRLPQCRPDFCRLADVRRLPAIKGNPFHPEALQEYLLTDCVPEGGSWIPTSASSNAPSARMSHTAVWTGAEMIVWGGFSTVSLNTGGRYYPSTDSWLPTSTGANVPSARFYHASVWTGSLMIVWGGSGTNTGGRYDPASDSWLSTSLGAGCPSARSQHTAVWTGGQMIVWGGSYSGAYLNSGGKYEPSTNSWTSTSSGDNVPAGRSQHTAVWTGSSMIVWGGRTGDTAPYSTSTGGIYLPSSDTWTQTSLAGCPEARALHTAVWTGGLMAVWGGIDISGSLRINTGGRYDPSSDSWATISETDVPEVRSEHTAVWAGNEMIVWGGQNDVNYLNNGGRYDPATDLWRPTSEDAGVPDRRCRQTALWTGDFMIVWGGGYPSLNSGGIYHDSPIPPLGFANNSAADVGACADEGVLVSWSAPSFWGDNNSGTRSFNVLRDGASIVTGLLESAFSFTDSAGTDGINYLYQVRAFNGCGASSTSAGTSAADTVGTIPPEVQSLFPCSWSSVPGASSYKLYRGTKATLPNLMNPSGDGCICYEGASTTADCSKDDPSSVPGRFFWYLVTASRGACEGVAGEGTGFSRDLSDTGNCSN